MRSDPAVFALTAPASLDEVLRLLAASPGQHTPVAGGTELMVAFNTGRLAPRSLLSLQHLRELRFIDAAGDRITLGAGTTFTDIRQHPALAAALPLLVRAASWTGSIANQNRATLGGNLCNASPAADTPPVLLAYDAEVELISQNGRRRLPYRDFHLGYKQTALRPEELLFSVTVPHPAPAARQYLRKVGTRNAQAISKVALAAVATLDGDTLQQLRLGAASLGDRPLRLHATEAALRGASLRADALDDTARRARAALAREIHPIDDIRSTARFRSHVAANLLEEFLRSLVGSCDRERRFFQ